MSNTMVFNDEALASYGFGHGHPFSHQRLSSFNDAFYKKHLDKKVERGEPETASRSQIELFHSHDYVERVIRASRDGNGYLDQGDTPAFIGVYDAAATVAGTTLAAVDQIMRGSCKHAFVPIAGLHHARRDSAAGFCVFNDCCIAIEALRKRYGIKRIIYIDIDAHHGDGVFYSYETDPDLGIVDIHEDGHYLYPGTGHSHETGINSAAGSKLNLPMPINANDDDFYTAWEQAEKFIRSFEAEFIMLQCGADSLAGDPITHLQFSAAAHRHATTRLCMIADRSANDRLLALGGGGYNLDNIANAWTTVVEALISSDTSK